MPSLDFFADFPFRCLQSPRPFVKCPITLVQTPISRASVVHAVPRLVGEWRQLHQHQVLITRPHISSHKTFEERQHRSHVGHSQLIQLLHVLVLSTLHRRFFFNKLIDGDAAIESHGKNRPGSGVLHSRAAQVFFFKRSGDLWQRDQIWQLL